VMKVTNEVCRCVLTAEAAQVPFVGERGRQCQWGWFLEPRPGREAQRAAGSSLGGDPPANRLGSLAKATCTGRPNP
jgi:hypothetical protein